MTDEGNSDFAGTSIMMVRQKIVFVGDVCVGKTSVMCRFTDNKFGENYDVRDCLFSPLLG
jgi:GTPase SAR1 family protein